MATLEGANAFLRQHYIAEFNRKFTVPAREKGTAFRRVARTDLEWIFTVQTERVVAQDNTVTITDRSWQLEKSRFRSGLAGCTVTIHEHLRVSIRYGPQVLDHYGADGQPLQRKAKPSKESGAKDRAVETPNSRDFHFPTAAATAFPLIRIKTRKPPSASRRGSANQTT
jgi:hypothetical protein